MVVSPKLVLSALTVAIASACMDAPTTPAPESAIVAHRTASASELIVDAEVLWTSGNATAINDHGVIVGTQVINGAQKTVRWENGVLTVLAGIPDGFRPRTLTNDERMLGTYANRPAIWTGSSFVQPPVPPGLSAWSYSNFSGVMGGSSLFSMSASGSWVMCSSPSTCPNNFILPIRLDGSTITILEAPGFRGGSVFDLNIAGQIVGSIYPVVGGGGAAKPYISSNGTLTILPVPPGTLSAVVHQINEDGEAIGYVHVGQGAFLPVKWKNGTYEVLPTPSPSGSAWGMVIGENNYSILQDRGVPQAAIYNHLYDGTTTTRLFHFASANVAAVNRNGIMVGYTSGASQTAMRWRVIEKPTDNTPPVITPTISGSLGEGGWYTSSVTVSWSVTDAESPVTSAPCAPTTITADTNGTDVTCSATSAGGSDSESLTVKRDATAPVIAFSGNQGTYTVSDNVSISCTASDATSGIDTEDCPSVNAPAYTLTLGANPLVATAADNAGLSTTASASFSVVVNAAGVSGLITLWVSNNGVAKSLISKLENAVAASGPSRAGKLNAMVHEIDAQTGKSISAQHAALLISMLRAL